MLAPAPGSTGADGAAAACRRLFEETTRGAREEAGSDATAAATVHLADTAYAAQHPDPADPGAVHGVLDTLVRRLGDDPNPDPAPQRPAAWQMTPADIAADLDVVGLETLVETWARTVAEDWSRAARS
ncbi:hypothetical protein SAMN05660991_04044 [Trujillonella endophytica]|uniref:Uncharacterized protein n=1 Tax=Trujillonella endophytica TaxID=673521 RepID=A0A1H8W4E4_9ACTN|nr:hypothetical protein SAMN05660991_04044 [Trujillella endophytica]